MMSVAGKYTPSRGRPANHMAERGEGRRVIYNSYPEKKGQITEESNILQSISKE